ncbi:MAG: Hpt domain-containing protein, partial [Gammaproteobacteria bacterium]|nr:Hpt domain-containing protein [Gammaproteobacteria bacterium]
LAHQKHGFADHNAMLDHYHRLNGSASMGGTAMLKKLLHEFETLLKATTDITHPKIISQQQAIQEHQSALLAWLQEQDLDRLFN